jgi:hypothetical protein|tara:strand:+ start:4941 stop:5288 length:348 start_codon:yes stop_codon:yes gene_type:complete
MRVCSCKKSTLVFVRKNDVVEYRVLNVGSGKDDIGQRKFKGNWRVEEKKSQKLLGIRCNSCDSWVVDSKQLAEGKKVKGKIINLDIDIDDSRKITEIDINSGILVVTKAMDKFFE